MKLRHQLILLQGKQIKVGSLISFFYCEECDANIFNTMEKLSDEEFNRISYILSEALYLKENFEEEKEPLYDVLELLLDTIFSPENLMISVTCDKEGYDILEEGFKKQETAFASMYRPEKEVWL